NFSIYRPPSPNRSFTLPRRNQHGSPHRSDRLAAGRNHDPDQGLCRCRLPSGQQVPGASSRNYGVRQQNQRVLSDRTDRAAGSAVSLISFPTPGHKRCDMPSWGFSFSLDPTPQHLKKDIFPMKLCDGLTSYVHAAFSGIWVQSLEPDEAEREIVRHARSKKGQIAVWDIAHGLRLPGNANSTGQATGAGDPLAALRALPALAEATG